MSPTNYIEWLDWKPCILRSIYKLGKAKSMPLGKLNELGRKADVTLGDYLMTLGIAELGPNSMVSLTYFGNKLYSKLSELEDIFVQGIEDVA